MADLPLTAMDLAFKPACHYCWRRDVPEWTRDHIVPTALGGINEPVNIVLSCPSCNGAKGSKMPTCSCWTCRLALQLWTCGVRTGPAYAKQRRAFHRASRGKLVHWQHFPTELQEVCSMLNTP